MMEHPAIAILLSLILGAFLLVGEIKRPQKARLLWRILASLIAAGCLYGILFPIQYEQEEKTGDDVIHFLTSGALPDSNIPSGVDLFTADHLVSRAFKNRVKLIPDLEYYLKTHPEIRKVHLYGYGLAAEELQQIRAYDVSFHAAAIPEGIIACNWPQTINSTAKLRIQGTYHHSGNKPVKLIWKGFGIHQDSITISGKGNTRFSFQAQPQTFG